MDRIEEINLSRSVLFSAADEDRDKAAVAAVVGNLVGSWLLLCLSAAVLIGSAIYTGDVRLKSRRR
jgi:hypothetical protein